MIREDKYVDIKQIDEVEYTDHERINGIIRQMAISSARIKALEARVRSLEMIVLNT